MNFCPQSLSQNLLTLCHPAARKGGIHVPGSASGANTPLTPVPSDPLGTRILANLEDRKKFSGLKDTAPLLTPVWPLF